ncbi:hypothetical protein PT281_00785 [Lactobacillus sp. ESL0701]|uniref:hypothetical protein n=1 Tax=Lactobacillus sp. ESL0701 TaxID=2983217 RepID=UPI0023F721B4|nr:hypothetical protein [Lactobacillus sp. ESL0701]MDF7671821.1 hypothetical protein [Lactobacillus sp. ESL0701]
MKKTTIWTIVAVALIALGGGVIYGTQKASSNQVNAAYTEAIDNGKNAVMDKDYVRASSDFAKAGKIKETSLATAYKNQADGMLSAIADAKDGEYTDALNTVDNVIHENHGYSLLIKQGQKLKTTLKDVKDNYEHELKPLFDQAKKAEQDKQYQQAVDHYQKILNLPYIDGKYYAKYKDKAQKGIANNKEAAKDNGSSVTTAKSQTPTNNSAIGDTGNAGKTGEGAMGNHKVNGKTVGTSQIAQLRKKLKSLGFDPMSWSPQDLIDMYRSTGHSDPSQITKQDVQNYLKP